MGSKNKIGLKLDHIAYAVRSTEDAIEAFKFLYPKITTFKQLEEKQNVYITYLTTEGEDYKIELVEPAKDPNPIVNMLKSKEVALYHLCYRVKNLKEAITYFKEQGLFMITSPFETSMEKGVWACHFFNPKCGIMEIVGKNE